MKRILITNDDGYHSLGLEILAETLKPLGEVIVVAPILDKSACGHSLTISKPLKFLEVKDNFYKLEDGTPSDCILLALNQIYRSNIKPNIIISGINKGGNMGEDITYSGTAAAAMEGALQGVPSLAISQVYNFNNKKYISKEEYDLAKITIFKIVKSILQNKFPLEDRKFLNINIPHTDEKLSKGIKITRAGKKQYISTSHKYFTPREEEFFFIGLPSREWIREDNEIMSDFEAVEKNYISISPITLDMTSYSDMKKVEKWFKKC